MRTASVPTTAAAGVILTTGHPKAALSALSALSIALPAAQLTISTRAQDWQRPCAAAEGIFNGAAAAALLLLLALA